MSDLVNVQTKTNISPDVCRFYAIVGSFTHINNQSFSVVQGAIMVNSSVKLGMTEKEALYEEIHNCRKGPPLEQLDVQRKITGIAQGGNGLAPCVNIQTEDSEDNRSLSEDTEDLYEVIPAHFAPENATKKPLATNDASPDINKTEYAEIVVAHKVTEIMPSRPTRESDNPILREDFAGNLSFLPNLRDVRKRLSLHSQKRLLDRDKRWPSTSAPREQNITPNTSPKLSPEQSPNTPRASPRYVNMEFPFIDSDRESRRSSVSSTGEKSLSSLEGEMPSPDYDNVKMLDFDTKRPACSQPLDIVYSDLDFRQAAKDGLVKCASSPCMISKFMARSNNLCPTASPRLPSRDHPIRPKSVSLQTHKFPNNGQLGNFMARYVGKTRVQRSSEKTLEAAVGDITGSTKAEHCVSVIVEIDSDKMRFSTNHEPWELIASLKLEDIGCASVCEHDRTVFGILESAPGREATCYVLRCPNAEAIYQVLADNFKAATSKNVDLNPWLKPRPRSGDVMAFENITYVGCLKMKKSYLVIKDSIGELLEKVNPKEFKSVHLEVHSGEIRLADVNGEKFQEKHVLPWILSIGVFDKDPRLFGYIMTEAKQGEKTRMFCHAFRCGRVTTSVAIIEAIRLGCQVSYTNGKRNASLNRRRSSNSVSSQGSIGESSCSPVEESLEEKPEPPVDHKASQRPGTLRRFSSMPMLRKISKKKNGSGEMAAPSERCERENNLSTEQADPVTPEAPEEFEFQVRYLCSTVINPPLRPKHLRECVKQFQKQEAKAHKRHGSTSSSSEVTLTVEEEGVHMTDPQRREQSGHMFFPFGTISCVKSHPESPQYFAFSTAVSGDTKHKCHLFLREGVDDSVEVVQSFQCFLQT